MVGVGTLYVGTLTLLYNQDDFIFKTESFFCGRSSRNLYQGKKSLITVVEHFLSQIHSMNLLKRQISQSHTLMILILPSLEICIF